MKQEKKISLHAWVSVLLLFAFAYAIGCGAGAVRNYSMKREGGKNATPREEQITVNGGITVASQDWGLGFHGEGTRPDGTASVEELSAYDAYYVENTEEKVLYLTFDCGYENGNTEAILDALKKHGVTGTFFVVGHYLESAPALVKRMVQEGHTVGNHTWGHPDISKLSEERFAEELHKVEEAFLVLTGTEMPKICRPPQGKYSEQSLSIAKKLGYQTFFWSLAYADWDQNKQPTAEEALEKLTKRIHPGAIVLLHNTSSTNAAILDTLLTKWEAMGYRIAPLTELYEK